MVNRCCKHVILSLEFLLQKNSKKHCVQVGVFNFFFVVLPVWSMRIHGTGEIIWLLWLSIVDSNFSISRDPKKKKQKKINIGTRSSTCSPNGHRSCPQRRDRRCAGDSVPDLPGIRRLTNDAHQAAQWTQSGYRIEGVDLRFHWHGISMEHFGANENQFSNSA